jgi:4-amino-4-deoxy-L-arabinose transferase-like glycosyltransferase
MKISDGTIQCHWPVILAIVLFSALRLATAPFFDLGVDEAHYVLYAKHLDLSYFDHPPLVGWVHALFYYTLGSSELLARIPTIILFAVTSTLCYRYILQFGSPKEALYGTLALNSSFMFGVLGIGLVPESLLLPLVFLLIFSVQKVENRGSITDYFLFGVLLGLAGLAKYTAILFVPALVIYLLWQRRLDIILNPRLAITAAVALLMISPVIIWNVQNDFISFKYQGSHVAGGEGIRFKTLYYSLLAQFGAYSPPLFLLAFFGFVQSLRLYRSRMKLPLLLGGVPFVFFLYASLYKRALPHWNAVFFLLFIPIGTVMLSRLQSKAARLILICSLCFSVLLTIFAHFELAGKLIRFPDYKSPFRDVYGVASAVQKANVILAADTSSNQHKALAVTNWSMASRVFYYSEPFGSVVFLINKRGGQFSLWQPVAPLGYDLLFISTHFFTNDIQNEHRCAKVEEAGVFDIELNGGKVDTVKYVWCRNYGGSR